MYKKMKKNMLLITSFLFIFSCLSGCGSEPAPEIKEPEVIPIYTEEKEEPEEVIEEPEQTSSVIEERESVNGQIQSYLTGEWTDEEIATRRPIAVMIPNNRPAMPQYGLSQAGIIYEAPVEGRITRLMAVFENFDDLKRI